MTALARRPHLRFRLVVVYVHHHLRPEADLESSSLDSLARQLGWEFRRADVYPDLESGNVSSVARRLRYRALGLVARDEHADAVVTAHHGTDQLETMLWAIVRGTGLAGLQGMAWRSTLGGCTLVRPLLNQSHSDCLALCNELQWSWFEDPGNRMRNRFRGRLRAEVLPCLEDFGQGLDRRIHQLTTLIREANNLVTTSTNGIFVAYGGSWYAYRDQVRLMAPILLGNGLRRAAISLGAPPDRLSNRLVLHAVELIVDNARHPRRIEWPAGVVIDVAADHILVSHIGTIRTNPVPIVETATRCRTELYDAR